MSHAIEAPQTNRKNPPNKPRSLSLAEIITQGIFRYFTGHKNWKQFYPNE